MTKFYALAMGILAVWRVTHLLNAEDGPFGLLVKLRRAAGSGFWGEMLDCFYCLSVWVAVLFALILGDSLGERFLLWPALSGAAILLERATVPQPAKAVYFEDEEPLDERGEHELLRKFEGPGRDQRETGERSYALQGTDRV